MNNKEKLEHFLVTTARENATQWVDQHVKSDLVTREAAINIVAAKIEEIVRDPASRNYGFRKAHLHLQSCKFVNGELVYTEPEVVGLILEHR